MPPSNILHSKTDPTLLARLKEMLDSADRADIAVGYFFVSGFAQVSDEISRLKKTRVLVDRADRPTLEAVAAGLHQARPLENHLEISWTIRRSQRTAIASEAVGDIAQDVSALSQTDDSEKAIEYLHQVPADTPQEPLAQEAGPDHRRRHRHQPRRGPLGPGRNPDPARRRPPGGPGTRVAGHLHRHGNRAPGPGP